MSKPRVVERWDFTHGQPVVQWRVVGENERRIIHPERRWWERLADKRDRIILAYLDDLIRFLGSRWRGGGR